MEPTFAARSKRPADNDPVYVRISIQPPTFTPGIKSTSRAVIVARNGAGKVIKGSYAMPLTLSDSDKSGHTKLSTTSVSSSGQRVTISYDGISCPYGLIEATQEENPPAFQPGLRVDHVYRSPSEMPAAASMAIGPENTIWFGGGRVLSRATLDGSIKEYRLAPDSAELGTIVVGPQGSIWAATGYMSGDQYTPAVERLNADGTMTMFPIPRSALRLGPENAVGLAFGPQRKLWIGYFGYLWNLGPTNGTYTLRYKSRNIWYRSFLTVDKALWVWNDVKYVPGKKPKAFVFPSDLEYDALTMLGNRLFLVGSTSAPVRPDGSIGARFSLAFFFNTWDPSNVVGAGDSLWMLSQDQVLRVREKDYAQCAYRITDPTFANAGVHAMILGPDGALWLAGGGGYLARAKIPPI